LIFISPNILIPMGIKGNRQEHVEVKLLEILIFQEL
jgi:hypothetical protein